MVFSAQHSQQKCSNSLVVAEVTVVDDGRVQTLSVGHNNLVDLLRDHAGGLAVLWVDYRQLSSLSMTSMGRAHTVVIQVADDSGKTLLRLFVQI